MKTDTDYPEQNVLPAQATAVAEITAEEVSKELVMHHLAAFVNNNLDALLSDYTSESVLVTPDATYSGVEEIRAFFVDLNRHFPKQASVLELEKMVAKQNLVYIVWHAKTPTLEVPMGSDTFVIKEGKIFQQTFVGNLNFLAQ